MNGKKPLVALTLLFLAFSLACGSFAPRPGDPLPPLPTLRPVEDEARPPLAPTATPATRSLAQPVLQSPTATPSPAQETPPEAAPTLTPTPPGNIILGQQARVISPAGVNIRQQPSTSAGRNSFFGAGALVTVLDGPIYADGYIWWQADDLHGKAGWIAGGKGDELWLTGDIGEPRPVNRAVRLGDTVSVSVSPGKSLTVRYEPGSRGFVARRIVPGTILSVIDGPVVLDNLRWWKILRDDGLDGWAAEGDGRDRWLSPLE